MECGILSALQVTTQVGNQHVSAAFLSGDNVNSTESLEDYTLLNMYVYYMPTFANLF
jgi:hypothetical protein